jgi:hypothetical protein
VDTSYIFEWGQNFFYLPNKYSPQDIGSGITPVQVGGGLAGLLPGTAYHALIHADQDADRNGRFLRPLAAGRRQQTAVTSSRAGGEPGTHPP